MRQSKNGRWPPVWRMAPLPVWPDQAPGHACRTSRFGFRAGLVVSRTPPSLRFFNDFRIELCALLTSKYQPSRYLRASRPTKVGGLFASPLGDNLASSIRDRLCRSAENSVRGAPLAR